LGEVKCRRLPFKGEGTKHYLNYFCAVIHRNKHQINTISAALIGKILDISRKTARNANISATSELQPVVFFENGGLSVFFTLRFRAKNPTLLIADKPLLCYNQAVMFSPYSRLY